MYLVFSDLDGTLLDHDTYDYTPALEGLEVLKKHAVPLVMVSSKTLPEMKILHEEMNLEAPFIFENGGGIFWPGRKENPEYLGMDVSELNGKQNLLIEAVGEPLLFITDMSAEEIVTRTGLTRDKAVLSQKRLTSLPFIIPSGKGIGPVEMAEINSALKQKSLSITKGGRFYHFLSSRSDKGLAIHRVIEYYQKNSDTAIMTIGIGDSENDIAMFKEVDIPVAVRKKDKTIIETGMAYVMATTGAGPEGFTEAVKKFITNNIKEGKE